MKVKTALKTKHNSQKLYHLFCKKLAQLKKLFYFSFNSAGELIHTAVAMTDFPDKYEWKVMKVAFSSM